ncbi:Abi-alpha family protein [Achromobacter xylosoxidans]|uniref:Abi-alpha family protein n=1 Tax=Alcaligenes xylosoxydans xylosoxydans TaxID=85698 RepID=UPI0015661072|nr:Abi-alpha family protein [Achromobacter xylosoxidans]QKI69221.1 DUF4393 domain-containing protein [Achromobacter xylosoxidans]
MIPDTDTTKEVAKATKAVADASGKLVEATRAAGGFIARFIAGPLEQGLGIFEDKLKYMRWDRQLRMMKRAETVIAECGFGSPTRAVPMKVAIPLFQGASLEDDDDLQDRWINMLVNAAYKESGAEVRRAYVDLLAQMDSVDVRILDKIYALPFEATHSAGVVTYRLPEHAAIASKHGANLIEPTDSVCTSLANLARLGCVKPATLVIGGEFFAQIHSTRLGRDFVLACRQPRADAA